MRKWIANIVPYDLLKRTVKESIESLVTLSQDGIFYNKFPDKIETPNYGDKWGVNANYIEINNLANFHGLKTGFRTVISADQIKVVQPDGSDIGFDWNNEEHFNLFLNSHIYLIKLGFEAIFIDSAKHIGGYDMENYTGVGALPTYEQIQYIIHEIRSRTGKTHLSFIGEKSSGDYERYEKLGLSTGTGYINPDDFHTVRDVAINYKYSKNYAPGVEVSNDNDGGERSYENSLHRINNALFAYEYPSDKLASFMQTEDLFPLRYDTNTHHLTMSNPSYSTDGTPESHWINLFAKDDGKEYNKKVGELFVHTLNL